MSRPSSRETGIPLNRLSSLSSTVSITRETAAPVPLTVQRVHGFMCSWMITRDQSIGLFEDLRDALYLRPVTNGATVPTSSDQKLPVPPRAAFGNSNREPPVGVLNL